MSKNSQRRKRRAPASGSTRTRQTHSLNRRDFLGVLGTGALAAAFPNLLNAAPRQSKPNLLVLWTDQERKDLLEVYGNRSIRVPNLNKLAQESCVFMDPYVSQPVCTPSRSTVMTGLWPHQNGCIYNGIRLPESIPCLPGLVADADYRTGYFGKWHLGNEIYRQHGFEEWQAIQEKGGSRTTDGAHSADDKSQYLQWLIEQGVKPGPKGSVSDAQSNALPIELSKPRFLQLKAIDFLRRHRNEPFILYVNYLQPHPPYTGPLNGMYEPRDMELPTTFSAARDPNEPAAYQTWRTIITDRRSGEFDLTQESGWRRLMANYWGTMSQVDQSIGAILAALDDLGLADNTITVHTSDHGDMMGAHRLLAKQVMYQQAVQVPWMMRIPQFGRQQRLVPGPVSHIDFVPTLLDLMGKPPREQLAGHSLVPWLQGGQRAEDHVFIQWTPKPGENKATTKKRADDNGEEGKGLSIPVRTVVSPDGWKLCLNVGDKNQLYNLKQDPNETTNVYDSGLHNDVIDRLREKIHTWQRSTNDTGFAETAK